MSASTETAAAFATQLLDHLTGARWFAGKGRTPELVGLTRLPWLHEPGQWPAVRCEVAEIRYLEPGHEPADAGASPAEAPELYQLALSCWPTDQPELAAAEIGTLNDPELGDVVVYDALQDPKACRLLLQRLLGAGDVRDIAGADGSLVDFHLVCPDALVGDLEPRAFTGEQSNTSVMFGEAAMLKLFRRLETGRNLDIEVHESLSRSGVADVAQLYGWVEGSWPAAGAVTDEVAPHPLTADLAMLVEKLADAEDGWELALESLRIGQGFAEQAAALGHALAGIHDTLRRQFGATQVRGVDVVARMTDRLAAATRVAPALNQHADGLQRTFAALGAGELATQRVHGDFHLGQTLRTPDGWKIIEFEGEPARTLPERAAPDSVWRDIAGMLCSFDYAAASAPGPQSRRWAESCRRAFLQSYAGGELSAPDEAVLRAYLADKAIYEVVYELRNRPDWVQIPLGAVASIASAPPTTSAAEPKKE